jgi:hypothetical protein
MLTKRINPLQVKSLLISLLAFFMLSTAYAQKNAVTDKKAANFVRYYIYPTRSAPAP